jgi:hypothetical protein
LAEFEHELRLLWAIAVNALLALSAYRAARAMARGDGRQIWVDTFLFWWTGQYIIVGALGLVGWLTPPAATVMTVVLSMSAIVLSRRSTQRTSSIAKPSAIELRRQPEGSRSSSFANDSTEVATTMQRRATFVAGSVVVCVLAALLWNYRVLPPMSDDPLTYHLPAAATWLQNGRIGIYETWFFNPANTYSPLGGSIFAAWLMLPFQNDVAARFMQMPAVMAIFVVSLQIVRRFGATTIVATLLALSAALCAPIIRQAGLAKDDLLLTAFVLMFINALAGSGRFAAVRAGLALGLAASMKVTAVYTLAPALLLAAPLALRHRKSTLIAAAVALLIAGPWYLRNWIYFGNPLFPTDVSFAGVRLFEGLFATTHSPRLREWNGLIEVFVTGYFSAGEVLAVVASVSLLGAIAFSLRKTTTEPIARICIAGPIIGTAAFVLTSPYAEVRFIYPWIVTAILAAALWPAKLRLAMSIVILIAALLTSFARDLLIDLLPYVAGGVVVLLALRAALARPKWRPATLVVVIVLISSTAWVQWRSYVLSLPALADFAWESKYADLGKAWTFLSNETPTNEPIAYTGTYLTYPMMGTNLNRKVIHVPVSATVTSLDKLARFTEPLSARNMLREVIPAAAQNPDEASWRGRLERSGARFLLINFEPPAGAAVPIEFTWASRDARFRRVFTSGNVVVFSVL